MASITLRPAIEQDIPVMLTVYFSAFASSPLNARCFPPSDRDVQRFWSAWIEKNIAAPDTHVVVAEDTDGDMLGWVRWVRKSRQTSWAAAAAVIDPTTYPAVGDRALVARFFQANADATRGIVGDEAHWFLSMIVTAPEAQRRGVGSALMRFGVERADEEGWMAYVNSSKNGRGLYEKFGFQVVGQSEFEELGMVQFHMTREARNRVG
ncbi:hypothetical protein FZEAL_2445 [Fusarium zealandicum]|uniref:N-acetyltransferase domain-containing protein n=1 Tax=Fusarium zealandicum TaxID=1053134 RepID=A0A8H4UR11_9HYPO|nr:hypothetical protein FZEAL_2445 [Fusarium zealandicum]